MKRRFGAMVLGLLVGTALMMTAGTVKSGERLPHNYDGHETIVIDLIDGSTDYTGWGEVTHGGRFTNVGSGFVDPDMNFNWIGTLTAADGSEINWVAEGNLATVQLTITLQGGTGRFQNVEGVLDQWESTLTGMTEEGGFRTITFDTRGSGWISF